MHCSRANRGPDIRVRPQLVALALIAGGLQLAAKSDYILVVDCGSSGTRMCARRRCCVWTARAKRWPAAFLSQAVTSAMHQPAA